MWAAVSLWIKLPRYRLECHVEMLARDLVTGEQPEPRSLIPSHENHLYGPSEQETDTRDDGLNQLLVTRLKLQAEILRLEAKPTGTTSGGSLHLQES